MITKMSKLVIFSVFTILIISGLAKATTHVIEASGMSFTPSMTNAAVGDTIRFEWVDGFHTTTCDGSTGTSRPVGAASWDEPLTDTDPLFIYVIQVAGTYNYKCNPHFPSMVGTIEATVSSITQISSSTPDRFALNQNYPNPFNPSTKIKFDIAKDGFAKLSIYNMIGQEVATLVNGNLAAGRYEVDWNALQVNSGVYFYKLETDGFIDTKKMLLVK
jgi:plastocyanin